MERRGKRIREGSIAASGRMRYLHAAFFLLAGALALGGCYVVPAQTAYVAPAPVVVAPAPVVVAGPRVPMGLRLRMEARTLVVGEATARR
jgi:hypothetical protein